LNFFINSNKSPFFVCGVQVDAIDFDVQIEFLGLNRISFKSKSNLIKKEAVKV
jgi:hypothetical protein